MEGRQWEKKRNEESHRGEWEKRRSMWQRKGERDRAINTHRHTHTEKGGGEEKTGQKRK